MSKMLKVSVSIPLSMGSGIKGYLLVGGMSELLWRERYRGENAHCWCQVRVGSETLKSDEFI